MKVCTSVLPAVFSTSTVGSKPNSVFVHVTLKALQSMNEQYPKTRRTLEEINQRIKELQGYKPERDGEEIETNSKGNSPGSEGSRQNSRSPGVKNRRTKSRLRSIKLLEQNSQALNRLSRRQSRRNRNVDRKPRRNVNTRPPLKKNSLKNRHKVPIVEPFSYERGQMFREPSRTYVKNGDCMIFNGVEFVTSLTVLPSGATYANTASDVIFTLPIAPIFFPGTELYKESQCWSKWRFKTIAMHYLPSCPSTTNGALLGFGQTDIQVGIWGEVSDSNSRIREALARKGAKLFHPFMETKIDIPLVESSNLEWYDTFIDDESELTVPALFYVLVETAIIDPNGGTGAMALGQIIVDYEIEFCNKALIDVPVPPTGGDIAINTTASLCLNAVSAGSNFAFINNLIPVFQVNYLAVILFKERMYNVTTGSTIIVNSPYLNTTLSVGQKGQVLFGWVNTETGPINITPNIEDAIFKNINRCFTLDVAITG